MFRGGESGRLGQPRSFDIYKQKALPARVILLFFFYGVVMYRWRLGPALAT